MFTERVTNAGTIEFVERHRREGEFAGDSDTRRIVRGEVRVSLFGFGKLVERMIVGEIEKNYAATTKLTLDYLAKR